MENKIRTSDEKDWSDVKLDGNNEENGQLSRFQVAKVYDESNHQNSYGVIVNNNNDHQELHNHHQDDEDNENHLDSLNHNLTQGSNYHYDTKNLRSFRYYTREALPRVDHYRNVLSVQGHISRPTLDELHGGQATIVPDSHSKIVDETKPSKGTALKLGWIQGVFVRCLLNIWGVMLFLRLSWVVGQAGLVFGCLVILLAAVVTTLTTLSMSAICTNGEVKGGGAYYMISRSLGPEFGGAIGLIFSLANAVAVAMYVVGFAETVTDIFREHDVLSEMADINIIRIVGGIATTALLGISVVGMEWESKTQMILLVILLMAMADFLIGSFIPASLKQQSQGFFGYDLDIIQKNFWPDFRGETFISVFSVFFPAATGILAGANISGDLSNPSKSLPKGTLLAVLVTTISYLLFAVICGATVQREASGVFESLPGNISSIQNCIGKECKYGLLYSAQVIEMVSAFGPIISAGIFAATLSSALASLVSAPKVFQAVCRDKLFPYISWFGKGFGKSNEPRRAYILTFVIAICCVLIGELNAIAPIISNFFLAAYCLINFSCFHASITNSPGFRPSFKYFNKWISLIGAILCLAVMFIMNWWTALLTFALIMFIYIYLFYKKPDVNWGSSTQAETYNRALKAIVKMNNVADHVKTFRPQLLVLSGRPVSRASLIDFSHCITKKISLLVCGHIESGHLSLRAKNNLTKEANYFLRKRKMDAFYEVKTEISFSEGAKSLMELAGIGKLRPNILMMGYKSDWRTAPNEDVLEYFKAIHNAFDVHMSVCILRLQEGFDNSEFIADLDDLNPEKVKDDISVSGNEKDIGVVKISASPQISGGSRNSTPQTTPVLIRSKMISDSSFTLGSDYSEEKDNKISSNEKNFEKRDIPKDVLLTANRFQRKQKKGTIDVWWLYDDGGLTMLLPYLLTTRSQWSGCKLRVFTLANRKDELDQEKRNMAALLSKFRIEFSNVTVVPDLKKPPKDESQRDFLNLISKFRERDNEKMPDTDEMVIKESDLLAFKEKNQRHVRLRELLLKHSSDASLIVMTLTVPRKGTCSAPLFMAWLETLTKGMPPFLLVRGNQTSVLTFYS